MIIICRINPCDDFYKYVCKRYPGQSAFTDLHVANQIKLVKKLKTIGDTDVS